ncbi:MAG: hypothetical protein QM811_07330 [Pirellulales bacterium]
MKSASNAKTAGWKGFLIQHVEKGVLAVMLVALVMLMAKGFGKEGLKSSQTPKELERSVAEANQHIVAVKVIPKEGGGEKFAPFDFGAHLKTSLEPRSLRDLVKDYNPNPGHDRQIDKRRQPKLFPIEDVHATALVGQLALNDPSKAKEAAKALQAANDKKLLEEAKKAAKKALEDQKKALADARKQSSQTNRKGSGGGEGGARGGLQQPKLETPEIAMPKPVVEQVVRPLHPAVVNLPNVTTSTQGMAVVTALIPYRKQMVEYHQALIDQKDRIPDRDVRFDLPILTKFVVERAEYVDPKTPVADLKWVDITNQTMDYYLANYKQLDLNFTETVVSSLLGPVTMPIDPQARPLATVGMLPKLADRLWQCEATHPRIPLISDLTETELELEGANQALLPGQNGPQNNIFAKQNPLENQPLANENPLDALPDYLLFRHLDMKVGLGRQYRYRVTAYYFNANYEVDMKYVDEHETKMELSAGSSAPSNPVSLPPIRAVLAGGETQVSRRLEFPPKSKIWIWKIDMSRGGEVAKDFNDVGVGEPLEFLATVKGVINRLTGARRGFAQLQFLAVSGWRRRAGTKLRVPGRRGRRRKDRASAA